MARKLDEAPFHPVVYPDERLSTTVPKLIEAFGRVYKELDFQLRALGAENFNRDGILALRTALGVPVPWSGFDVGEVVPAGTLVICSGVIWRAKRDVTADGSTIYEGENWERAG